MPVAELGVVRRCQPLTDMTIQSPLSRNLQFRVALILSLATLALTVVLFPVYTHSSTSLDVIPAAVSSAFGVVSAFATIRLSAGHRSLTGWVCAFLHAAFLTRFIAEFVPRANP